MLVLDLVWSKLESSRCCLSAPLLGRNQQDGSPTGFTVYLVASLRDVEAVFVHVSHLVSVFGGATSIKLCGLLRKTGAKIPAGPFRYSDARQ